MTWSIRPAGPDDREFILSLAPRLAEGFALPPWRTASDVVTAETGELESALRGSSNDFALLVGQRDDGTLGGVVYLQLLIDFFTRAPYTHIAILATSADTEGQGVARALLNAAETWCRERGASMLSLHVFVENVRARAVYEHLGFQPELVKYTKTL